MSASQDVGGLRTQVLAQFHTAAPLQRLLCLLGLAHALALQLADHLDIGRVQIQVEIVELDCRE